MRRENSGCKSSTKNVVKFSIQTTNPQLLEIEVFGFEQTSRLSTLLIYYLHNVHAI